MRHFIHSTAFRVRTAVGVAAGLVLAACSGGDKIVAPDSSTPIDTRLSAADSLYMANTLASASFDAMKNLRRMPTTTVPGVLQNAPPCTPSTVTGGADANANGIPDDRTAQYTTTGCSYTNAGANVTVSGSVRVQELPALLGYRVTYSQYTVTATKGDSLVRTVMQGVFEYQWTSGTSAASLDNTTLSIEVRSSVGSITLTRSSNFVGQFSPVSGSTIRINNLFPSGTFTLTGTIGITATVTGNQVQAGLPTSQTLNMNVSTTTNLATNISCSSDAAFTAGQLAADVSGSNQGALSVRFTGCGSGTTTGPGVTGPGKR